jgi:hypothetical protein
VHGGVVGGEWVGKRVPLPAHRRWEEELDGDHHRGANDADGKAKGDVAADHRHAGQQARDEEHHSDRHVLGG